MSDDLNPERPKDVQDDAPAKALEELIALRTLSGDASPEEAAVVESLASASAIGIADWPLSWPALPIVGSTERGALTRR